MKLTRSILAVTAFCALTGSLALAQNPVEENSRLKGDYFFRHVFHFTGSGLPSFGSYYGTASFDGNGLVKFSGQVVTTTKPTPARLAVIGIYSVYGNGLFSVITDLEFPANTSDVLYGTLTPLAITAASTQQPNLFDLFVAIPKPATAYTNATFNGKYQLGTLDYLGGKIAQTRQALFQVNANGQGGFSDIAASGSAGNLPKNRVNQTISGGTYSLSSDGSGRLTFPAGSAAPESLLVSGDKVFYLSADKQMLLGGSANGYDMIVGITALPGVPGANDITGLYATAGVSGASDCFFGADNFINSTYFYTHFSVNNNYDGELTRDYATLAGFDNFLPSGEGVNGLERYIFGASGQAYLRIGDSNPTDQYYSLMVGTKYPSFSGTGVYLNPTGIVNTASNAPYTFPATQGAFMSLYGSGLSNTTATAATLPIGTNLGGVQVLVDGVAAPVYYVSSGVVIVIVPFGGPFRGYTTFQVNNNGKLSNAVTVYRSATGVGVFSLDQTGAGPAAALHANFSAVTRDNPAKAGETLLLFLNGLGALNPAIQAGVPGGSNPFNLTTQAITVKVDGVTAQTPFKGLAPGLLIYQINFVVPAGTQPGDSLLDLFTHSTVAQQVVLPIGK